MDWVKLLTEFDGNPKVLSVGLAGAGLYARALAYSGKYETDGVIPASWVHQAVAHEGLADLPKHLLSVGLWETLDEGISAYRIKDYTEVNKSKDEMESLREKRSGAGKKGGKAKRKASAKQTESKAPSNSYSHFSEWLVHYRATTKRDTVRGSKPARESFDARIAEGRSLDDLKLATVGAQSDQFLRDNGHVVPETILRASKVERYIQLGRDAKGQGAKRDPLQIIAARAA